MHFISHAHAFDEFHMHGIIEGARIQIRHQSILIVPGDGVKKKYHQLTNTEMSSYNNVIIKQILNQK